MKKNDLCKTTQCTLLINSVQVPHYLGRDRQAWYVGSDYPDCLLYIPTNHDITIK